MFPLFFKPFPFSVVRKGYNFRRISKSVRTPLHCFNNILPLDVFFFFSSSLLVHKNHFKNFIFYPCRILITFPCFSVCRHHSCNPCLLSFGFLRPTVFSPPHYWNAPTLSRNCVPFFFPSLLLRAHCSFSRCSDIPIKFIFFQLSSRSHFPSLYGVSSNFGRRRLRLNSSFPPLEEPQISVLSYSFEWCQFLSYPHTPREVPCYSSAFSFLHEDSLHLKFSF